MDENVYSSFLVLSKKILNNPEKKINWRKSEKEGRRNYNFKY